MSRRKKWQKMPFLFGPVLTSFCLGGFGMAQEMADAQEEYRITCIIPSKSGTVYWQETAQGMWQAAEDLGVELTVLYTDNNEKYTALSQEDALETAILIESQAIIFSYGGVEEESDTVRNSVNDYLLRARSEGRKVVLIDCDADASLRDAYVGIDNEAAGEALGAYVLEHLQEGQQAFLTLVSGYDSHLNVALRVQGIQNAFAAEPDRLIVIESEDLEELDWLGQMETLLDEESPGALIAVNERSTIVMAQLLERSKKTQEVALYGFDLSEQTRALLQKGTLSGLVSQRQYEMGYQSVSTAVELLEGGTPDSLIDYEIYMETETVSENGE